MKPITVRDLPKFEPRGDGALGAVKITHHNITCPECGQQVVGVAHDGVINGYCGIHGKKVLILVKE